MPSKFMDSLRKKLNGSRRAYVDEEMAVMIPENGLYEQGVRRNNWRYLDIGEWKPLLHMEKTLEGVFAVFPAGVYLKNASNSNRFHVELMLDAPGKFLLL